jgi:hypothetical protein
MATLEACVLSMGLLAFNLWLLGYPDRALAESNQLALSAERGFSFWSSWASAARGWARAQQERRAEGIVQIREGLAALRSSGAELAFPWGSALLSEALGNESQGCEGLSILTEALASASKNGDKMYEAEIHRLKGERVLASGTENQSEAESSFRHAIDIARRQQAGTRFTPVGKSYNRTWHSSHRVV